MISRRKFFQTAAFSSAGLALGGSTAARQAAVTARTLLASAGTEGPCPSGYARMFPNLKPPPPISPEDVEDGLRELGEAMIEPKEPQIGMNDNEPSNPPAGYTYFGQFIDHDLTLDLTPLGRAGDYAIDVAQIRNFRTSHLDLDQLYGGGPNLSPHLYHADPDPANRGKERFLIGKTSAGTPDDLPRNPEGTALTGDPREDENLILAQLHVAFLKLHNLIISSQEEMSASPHYKREGDSDFAVAQRVVRWHYQWIVRNDYLPTIVCKLVVNKLDNLEKDKRARPPSDFAIPVEFSAAAFRFGHSMVRNRYDGGINRLQRNVDLETLLSLTGARGLTPSRGKANVVLPAEWRVCWDRFFEIGSGPWLNHAARIDTTIAASLHHLDEPRLKQFSVRVPGEPPEPSLPVRTLKRGFRMRLPSGEQVAAEVSRRMPDIKVLKEDQIVEGPHKEILMNCKYGFRNNTPLWYYILKEAELEKVPVDMKSTPPKFVSGISLGPVGSYLVADTILGALAADRDSYMWNPDYPNWKPTLTGVAAPPGKAMANLLSFVASAEHRTDNDCQ